MASKTNTELVLDALRASSRPLDDDQLSFRSGVRPRQTVNQICRGLERSGVLRRYPGPDLKIVNELVTSPTGDEPPPVNDDAVAGNSREQRAAQSIMLAALAQTLGVALSPRKVVHSSGARVEVDGTDDHLRVLVECWAHQGPAKPAQKYKLMNDAVKLHWIAQDLTPPPEQLILCVSDEAAVRHLRGASWQGQAIADLGVTLHVVSLPADVVESVSEAQKRQHR